MLFTFLTFFSKCKTCIHLFLLLLCQRRFCIQLPQKISWRHTIITVLYILHLFMHTVWFESQNFHCKCVKWLGSKYVISSSYLGLTYLCYVLYCTALHCTVTNYITTQNWNQFYLCSLCRVRIFLLYSQLVVSWKIRKYCLFYLLLNIHPTPS